MAEKHWSQISEETAVAGIRILYWIYRLGGRLTFFVSLWPVIIFYWLGFPGLRHASHTYFEHVARFTGRKAPAFFSGLFHTLRFADTILDKLLAVSGAFAVKDLRVIGEREALLKDKRGAILVTAHAGCLELCQVLSANRSDARRLHVLVHTKHAQRFNRIIRRINPAFDLNHIEVTEISPALAIQLSQYVEAGDFIVIVGDRTPIASNAVITADFLGESAPFPTGPYLLANVLSAPLWSMICTRDPEKKARYAVFFEKLWEPVPVSRKERQTLFQTLAGRYSKTLEKILVRSPYDWFNFFDFWHPGQSEKIVAKRTDTQKKEH